MPIAVVMPEKYQKLQTIKWQYFMENSSIPKPY
jgi:hypothetical protein